MGKFDRFIQNRILRPIRLRAILKILNKLPPGTILDIGCMDDYLIRKLPKRFDYFGIDSQPLKEHPKIKKQTIEKFLKEKNKERKKGKHYEKSEKYDIVLATEVLEHVDDPVNAMDMIKKLSKKYILVSVPNEPFFSIARLFVPAKEHLWTIFPWALEKHFGKPILTKKACFNRTHIALWKKG